ncbi:hypothetical protein [Streptomyces sp. NPDC005131]
MTVPLLFVPPVPDGDRGLILEVNGVSPEPRSRRWYVLTLEGDAFCLPPALWPWAMELDAQTRRRELRMPAVFAFRRVGGTVAVDMLSRA